MPRPVSILVLSTAALTLTLAECPVAGSPGFAAETARPIRITVPIKSRSLANRVQKDIRTTQGDVLEVVFTTDESAELHLHGYDIYLNVEPGTPSVLRVEATIAGRYPLEAHRFGDAVTTSKGAHSHVVLLYLSVYPR